MVRRHGATTDEIARMSAAGTPVAPDASIAIEAWLSVFVRLLRLGESQRREIRDELGEHLRERARDLMLSGRAETEAVRLAIEELGETAALAKRFEAANRPQRRLLMHLSLLGLSAGVITLGVFTLSPNQPHVPATMFETAGADSALAGSLKDQKITLDFDNAPLSEVVKFLGDAAQHSVVVDWPRLEEREIGRDNAIKLEVRGVRLEKAFELVANELSRSGAAVEWRFNDDLIELGTREHFDLRDLTLVSYDIGDIVQSISTNYGLQYDAIVTKIAELIQTMVEPINWRDNGGSLAHLQVVGGKLFVEAPKRMHGRIAWILEQLRDGAEPVEPKQSRNTQPTPLTADLPLAGLRFVRQRAAAAEESTAASSNQP